MLASFNKGRQSQVAPGDRHSLGITLRFHANVLAQQESFLNAWGLPALRNVCFGNESTLLTEEPIDAPCAWTEKLDIGVAA